MTIVRLGYVAMSMELKNASPSKTMTFSAFQKIDDREAAIHKLERISLQNIHNTLRMLKHNYFSHIHFYRLSSRLIPLANHEALKSWDYIQPLAEALRELGEFAKNNQMRIDFHPDHFVVLNSPRRHVFDNAITTLNMHHQLLKAMGVNPTHRCVIHVGGHYKDKEKSLERFIENWESVPQLIQKMIMLENDDTSFTLEDTLDLGEKLNIPIVFDYHHHLAHHEHPNWEVHWKRVVDTWQHSPLPIKMHISSPRSQEAFRSHADYVDLAMLFEFLHTIKGSVPRIDCMIEAKKKDKALFKLMEEIKARNDVELIDKSTFYLK